MERDSGSAFEVAAYYFPNYHVDARNARWHGPGWSEWELVKRAVPRFEGHDQPKVPAWGHTDEADPAQMAQKISAAADHGLTAFIFDWYWYDDGPYLQRGLEDGFLKAPNVDRLKFACMWANHDWHNIHPATWADLRMGPRLLCPGKVAEATYLRMVEHCIERYFRHPSHWMVDGCPYFSIYELGMFVQSAGSVAEARRWLDEFRRCTVQAGFSGLHLNAVVWGSPILPGESKPSDPVRLVGDLGFDSTTSYVWIHHGFPRWDRLTVEYAALLDVYLRYWTEWSKKCPLPYYPNVSMGWDSSPRISPTDMWDTKWNYPCTPIVTGNTPAAFREALAATRRRTEEAGGPRRITINSWNEWTEGSYLEPDTRNGMGYLEAIRDVFG